MPESTENRLFSLLSEVYRSETDSAGALTGKELYTLLALRQTGSATIHTVAEKLSLPPAETGILLAQLHEKSLLTREAKRQDLRSSVFTVTAEGNRQLDEALPGYMAYLDPENTKEKMTERTVSSYEELFNQQYRHSKTIVCSFIPLFDDEKEIIDLEYRCGNTAFHSFFPPACTIRNYTLVSRILYDQFDTMLIAASTVWKTGKTITMTINTLFPFVSCALRVLRDSPDTIIFITEPADEKTITYLHSIFEQQTSFVKKPVRIAVDCQTGRILGANKPACKFYGSSEPELLTKNIRTICRSAPETITALLSTTPNTDPMFEMLSLAANNNVQKVTMHVHPVSCNNARILFLLITRNFSLLPEINERSDSEKKSMKALCLFEARYNTAIQGIASVLRYIEKQSITCSYKPGEHFCEYSTVLPTFGFIIEGVFRIYHVSAEGEETTIELIRPGAVIDSRTVTEAFAGTEIHYEAVIPAKVLVLNQEVFMRQAVTDPHFFELLYFVLKDRMTSLGRRGLMLMGSGAKERYAHFLSDNKDVAASLRNRDIASYLGITPETLSRIKSTS
jgi:CRP-like cAMP-binding protein/DNA-binding MarR family transcriptional regulator